MADGTVVLKTDDDFLIYVSPIDPGAAERGELDATQRGEVLSGSCRSCHSFSEGERDGIGPNLWRVYGRHVAARDGYAYSPALRALGGRWTEDILRSFLADPGSVAPGTSMQLTTRYTDAQVSDLIAFLKTVR
jgi:cytochrome c